MSLYIAMLLLAGANIGDWGKDILFTYTVHGKGLCAALSGTFPLQNIGDYGCLYSFCELFFCACFVEGLGGGQLIRQQFAT